jgi:hypothetical protein
VQQATEDNKSEPRDEDNNEHDSSDKFHMKRHLPTLCRQEVMKRVIGMRTRMKKGMRSRENECDLIMYKLVNAIFLFKSIYVYKIICARLFKVYLMKYL